MFLHFFDAGVSTFGCLGWAAWQEFDSFDAPASGLLRALAAKQDGACPFFLLSILLVGHHVGVVFVDKLPPARRSDLIQNHSHFGALVLFYAT